MDSVIYHQSNAALGISSIGKKQYNTDWFKKIVSGLQFIDGEERIFSKEKNLYNN